MSLECLGVKSEVMTRQEEFHALMRLGIIISQFYQTAILKRSVDSNSESMRTGK